METKELGPVGQALTDESKWTRGTLARDCMGLRTSNFSGAAVCRCVAGWIDHCYPSLGGRMFASDRLRAVIGDSSITRWNDDLSRTFDEVKAAVAQAGI
jgi:hypothetical protein